MRMLLGSCDLQGLAGIDRKALQGRKMADSAGLGFAGSADIVGCGGGGAGCENWGMPEIAKNFVVS